MSKKNFIQAWRKPRSASDILQGTLKAYRLDKKLDQYKAFPHWPEIVGDDVAKVAFPEKIVRGKILVVSVIDASWIQELSLQKLDLLEKIHSFPLGAAIEDIKFVSGNPKAFTGSK